MRKKILFFCNNLYGGGAEKILQTILNNLSQNKYDITLYSLHQAKLNSLYPDGICYKYLYRFAYHGNRLTITINKFINKFIYMVYKYCKPALFYKLFIRGKYDVEIAFIEGYATRIISGSRNKNSKKIAWVHTDLLNGHWTKICYKDNKEEELAYSRYDTVACVSKATGESFLSLFPKVGKIQVVYNPIDDVDIITKSKIPLSIENSIIRGKHTFVAVGRLVKQKGFDRLLKVVEKLHADNYDFALNILGDGPEKDFLSNYIKEHQLAVHVKLLGNQDNPYPFIKAADSLILSSHAEGYSTVVTEALILGVPVIATKVSGIWEQIGEGGMGIIVENSEEALYFGIKKVLDSDVLLEELKYNAQRGSSDFNLKSQMSELEQILLS